jgi:alpha-glucosidase
MGTSDNKLALYVVYENPMPMVADDPQSYEGQTGFEFIEQVPTTWDETRFLTGDPGEYIVLARRKGADWYIAGITNWTPREINVPLDALVKGDFAGDIYTDGSMEEAKPNAINKQPLRMNSTKPLHISMAPGGGFVASLHKSPAATLP